MQLCSYLVMSQVQPGAHGTAPRAARLGNAGANRANAVKAASVQPLLQAERIICLTRRDKDER